MKYLVILIIGLSLIVLGMLMSCESQPIIPQTNSKSEVLKIEVSTYSNGTEYYETDGISYINLRGQGLYIFRNGELIKQIVMEDIKNFKITQ